MYNSKKTMAPLQRRLPVLVTPFQSLSTSGIVTSTVKVCRVSPIFVVFQFAVVNQKMCCVLKDIVVFRK